MNHSIVRDYVDCALEQLRRRDLLRNPGGIPKEMRDPTIPDVDDWVGWKAIPSRAREGDLDVLESEIGLKFPPLYREFLLYKHFLELTSVGVGFARHLCNDWRETLRDLYLESWVPERIVQAGLIPFGSENAMDAGPVCFDTRRRSQDGDCPIVYWDAEWIGSKREVGDLWSSSAAMFRCLHLVASNDVNFTSHLKEFDDAALLPKKRALLAQFLHLDPSGAGKAGRSYWTGWGVKPKVDQSRSDQGGREDGKVS